MTPLVYLRVPEGFSLWYIWRALEHESLWLVNETPGIFVVLGEIPLYTVTGVLEDESHDILNVNCRMNPPGVCSVLVDQSLVYFTGIAGRISVCILGSGWIPWCVLLNESLCEYRKSPGLFVVYILLDEFPSVYWWLNLLVFGIYCIAGWIFVCNWRMNPLVYSAWPVGWMPICKMVDKSTGIFGVFCWPTMEDESLCVLLDESHG